MITCYFFTSQQLIIIVMLHEICKIQIFQTSVFYLHNDEEAATITTYITATFSINCYLSSLHAVKCQPLNHNLKYFS